MTSGSSAASKASWNLVRTGERGELATLEDGVRTARVTEAVLRAASAGATVTIEEEAA